MRLFCVISLVVLLSCKESTSVNHIGPLASVTMGGENACGLTPDGVAYCWGINATGGVWGGARPPQRGPGGGAGTPPSATPTAHARLSLRGGPSGHAFCLGL